MKFSFSQLTALIVLMTAGLVSGILLNNSDLTSSRLAVDFQHPISEAFEAGPVILDDDANDFREWNSDVVASFLDSLTNLGFDIPAEFSDGDGSGEGDGFCDPDTGECDVKEPVPCPCVPDLPDLGGDCKAVTVGGWGARVKIKKTLNECHRKIWAFNDDEGKSLGQLALSNPDFEDEGGNCPLKIDMALDNGTSIIITDGDKYHDEESGVSATFSASASGDSGASGNDEEKNKDGQTTKAAAASISNAGDGDGVSDVTASASNVPGVPNGNVKLKISCQRPKK